MCCLSTQHHSHRSLEYIYSTQSDLGSDSIIGSTILLENKKNLSVYLYNGIVFRLLRRIRRRGGRMNVQR